MSLSFSIMLLFTIYSNSAYAQVARTIDIKITSPAKGQEIPVGIKNLPISGTSTYNSTMSCQVSLIVDDVKPYQKAVAAHGATIIPRGITPLHLTILISNKARINSLLNYLVMITQ